MVGESDSDEWRPPPSSFTCMQGQPVPFPVHVHVYTLPCAYGIQYRPNNVMCVHDLIIREMLRKKARQHNTTERQSNTMQLAQGSYFFKEKNCLGWDSNPRPSAC